MATRRFERVEVDNMRLATVFAVLVVALSCSALPGCSRGGSELDGTQWKLIGWSVSSIDPAQIMITAAFADGQVSGNGGVNNYSGSFRPGRDRAIALGPFVRTEMAGAEPAMRAEGAYLTLLGQARSYRVEAGRLTLFDAGGNEVLSFAAVPAL